MLNVTDNITNYCSLPWLQQWWELLDTNWDLLPLIVVVKRKMCHIPADGYCRFACQTSWCVSMSVSVCVYVTTKRSFIWLWVAPSAPSDHGGRNFTCVSSSLATRSRLPTGPFVPLSPLCTKSSADRPRWDGTVLTGKRFFFYYTSHSLERLERWFSASSVTVSTSWRQFWRAWSVASCPGTILIKTRYREGIRQLIDP